MMTGRAIDDGEIGFVYFVSFERKMKLSGDLAVCGEEEDTGSWPVETVNGMDLLADLITEDFHGHLIARLRVVGGDDQLSGGFVDRDDPLVLEENLDGPGL